MKQVISQLPRFALEAIAQGLLEVCLSRPGSIVVLTVLYAVTAPDPWPPSPPPRLLLQAI